jgi:hypothetical protein
MYVPFPAFCVLRVCVCKCVLYYCHQVSTQLQLNIYHIISISRISAIKLNFDCNYAVTAGEGANVVTCPADFL